MEDEVVCLPESSSVLELMLRFMSLERKPDVKTMSFEDLSGLSEAVEKYEVFSAMAICNGEWLLLPFFPLRDMLIKVQAKFSCSSS